MLVKNLVLKSPNIISGGSIMIYHEPRQPSWDVLSKKWSATVHVQYDHVYNHELYDAAFYAERTR
jgi:hypothetical protein